MGAHLVMGGQPTVGALVAFNMLARVSSPILKLVQLCGIPAGGHILQRLETSQRAREPGLCGQEHYPR